MLHYSRTSRRSNRKSKPRQYQSLQKPYGVSSPRVQKVGGEHFAIVCVDPAKHRSPRRRTQCLTLVVGDLELPIKALYYTWLAICDVVLRS